MLPNSVPKVPMDNEALQIQDMAWRQPDVEPLTKPMKA